MSILFCVMFCVSAGAWGQKEVIFSSMKQSAEQGDKMAQYWLGKIYENGSDAFYESTNFKLDTKIQADIRQSIYWYSKAAKQGYAQAQLLLGIIYEFGKGVITKDGDLALYWYEKALHNKNDGSMNESGIKTAEWGITLLKSEGYSSSRTKP